MKYQCLLPTLSAMPASTILYSLLIICMAFTIEAVTMPRVLLEKEQVTVGAGTMKRSKREI